MYVFVCAQGESLCFSGSALKNLCLEKMWRINDEGEEMGGKKERVMAAEAVTGCVGLCACVCLVNHGFLLQNVQCKRYEDKHTYNRYTDKLQLDPSGVCVYSVQVAHSH